MATIDISLVVIFLRRQPETDAVSVIRITE
jgi:hypothetical protein